MKNPAALEAKSDTDTESFMEDVIRGLSRLQKEIPPKYFYDEKGSELFHQITELDEYYITRTETQLMKDIRSELRDACDDDHCVMEFGSGSGERTDLLLDTLNDTQFYVPIDVSEDLLQHTKQLIESTHPGVKVIPVLGDFQRPLQLPASIPTKGRLGYFPGSTIGNLSKPEARDFLIRAAKTLGPAAQFLVGVDRLKGLDTLLAAYNDSEQVTAAFNLNLLTRINRELGADFDLDGFEHEARFNQQAGRIEMHLISRCVQKVHIGGRVFEFDQDETIHTENSHKYTPEQFINLSADAGWQTQQWWTDKNEYFGLYLLTQNTQ